MHCRYCAQSDRGKPQWVSSPKDVLPFIDKLKASGITVSSAIELWGGEPFVYWKTLRVLVPALRELYPQVRLSAITNGTLIDEEKITFCEKYGLSLVFSHDGPGYHLRGKDPLQDPVMVDLWRLAFSKLRCSVNCVLTPANTDLEGIREFFKRYLGEVHVNFEGIMTHLGVQDKELLFTNEQIVALQHNIFTDLSEKGWDEAFPSLTNNADNLIRKLVKREALDPCSVKCAMNRPDHMAVNLRGDILSCHDHVTEDNYVGRIEEPEKADISAHFKPWRQREKCRRCLVLSMCRGSCPQVEGLARTLTCTNEFAYHLAVFQAVFWNLFGLILETCALLEKDK